ncbi:hypothetical protein [Roseixanthobacter liquoris]|uniref:hypothetical protein n=1 Tax=Roseixanthobacter liquoris TaxID=3119921 RepID=UPI003727CC01
MRLYLGQAAMMRSVQRVDVGDVSVFFGTAFLFFVIMVFRVNIYLVHPSFWAEDLPIFWFSAYRNSFFDPLLTPYSGYLNFIPRLIAALAELFPYKVHPAFYVYASLLMSAWTAAVLSVSSGARAQGVVFGMLLALMPHSGEVWATPTNLQWVMACALPMLALGPVPSSRFVRGNQLAFVLATALTGPFMLVSAPLWACRAAHAFRTRDGFGAILVLIALCGALVQLYFIATQNVIVSPHGETHIIRTSVQILLRWVEPISRQIGVWSFVFFGLIIWGLFYGRQKGLRTGLIFMIFATFASVLIKFLNTKDAFVSLNGDRYFYIPAVLTAFSFASLIFDDVNRWVKAVAVILLLRMLFLAAQIPILPREPADFASNWRGYAHLIGRQDVLVTFPPQWQFLIEAKQPATPAAAVP